MDILEILTGRSAPENPGAASPVPTIRSPMHAPGALQMPVPMRDRTPGITRPETYNPDPAMQSQLASLFGLQPPAAQQPQTSAPGPASPALPGGLGALLGR